MDSPAEQFRHGRMKRFRLLTAAVCIAACGDQAAPDVSRLEIDPGATLVVGLGGTAKFQAVAFDSSGQGRAASGALWESLDAGVATVGGNGLATALSGGVARIVVELDGVSDTASLEVWVAPSVASHEAGTSYFGRNEYVQYIPGTLPVVISAPHGGALGPSEVATRTWGTLVTDAFTAETLLAVREAFLERTGEAPHIVISHLLRSKLDPNREIGEAAQDDPFAENAWEEFQGFIEIASDRIEADFGRGLYLDLHGHGHAIQRLELGYLLSAADLNQDDAALDGITYSTKSSIAALAGESPRSFSALLRGEASFGAYLDANGVRSVPSPDDPSPGSDAYFSGGYNTARHGSRTGGRISGIQLELHRPGIRDTEENRRAFAARLAATVEQFMLEHYGFFRAGE
jgi:hypothetical protein